MFRLYPFPAAQAVSLRRIYLVIFTLVSILSLTAQQDRLSSRSLKAECDLAKRLTKMGYDSLFGYLYKSYWIENKFGYEDIYKIDTAEIKPDPKIKKISTLVKEEGFDNLVKLVNDSLQPCLPRFIAYNMLRSYGCNSSDFNAEALTSVLISALINNYTGDYSDWGFKGECSEGGISSSRITADGLGYYGREFTIPHIKNSAVYALRNLLTDTSRVQYVSVKNKARLESMRYDCKRYYLWNNLRIKDFAALYISAINDRKVIFSGNVKERDIEISKIRDYIESKIGWTHEKERKIILQIKALDLYDDTRFKVGVSYPKVDATQLQRLDNIPDPACFKKGDKQYTCAITIENEGMISIFWNNEDGGYLEIHNAYQLKPDTLKINSFKTYPIGLTDSLITTITYYQLKGNEAYVTTGKIDKPDSIKRHAIAEGTIFRKYSPVKLKYIINGKAYTTEAKASLEEYWEGREYGTIQADLPYKDYFQIQKTHKHYKYVARLVLKNNE